MAIYETVIEIGEIEVDCFVDYTAYKGYAGSLTEPPEPPSIEIGGIYIMIDGEKSYLPDGCLGDIEAEIDGYSREQAEADECARADYLYQRRKDEGY